MGFVPNHVPMQLVYLEPVQNMQLMQSMYTSSTETYYDPSGMRTVENQPMLPIICNHYPKFLTMVVGDGSGLKITHIS
ncbi:hypothetical protein FNV43_RR10959 [Rhamnella rubrinervis]|uniref:Uncharacterized protein n=1 Tax=Rhamnella rubrinervis TaxID=2594499 RepID=A0A8K0H4T6_9ROSA|nr:hypothetical protein FNV43_RR10959 [Rhamnella rubrinervis]